MKKNIQSFRFVALLALTALSCQFSMIQAQDSLYIYQGGAVVAKRAILQIDSMTFTAPVPAAPVAQASACGAYLGPNNTLYKQFLCRNLGAAGDLYSGGLTYDAADNGDLYQWGRPTDGHEKRTSTTISDLATTNTPNHANFILAPSSPYDWRSGGANDTRWTDATKAANDPCPAGYKVPSQAQWAAVVANNTKGTWATGYGFGSTLFLPASGYRDNGSALVNYLGSYGYYWSSTVYDASAYNLVFNYVNVFTAFNSNRAMGCSVRCVAE